MRRNLVEMVQTEGVSQFMRHDRNEIDASVVELESKPLDMINHDGALPPAAHHARIAVELKPCRPQSSPVWCLVVWV